MDWFAAVMALVGVAVGVGAQELRLWREKKDKYKDMVFEKRLDAHQGAYYRCMKLCNLLLPHKLIKTEGLRAGASELLESIDWMNKNALYLNEDSRVKLGEFLHFLAKRGSEYVYKSNAKNVNIEEEMRKLLIERNRVIGSIKKGIGVKYLPEIGISGVDVEGQRSFDETVKEMTELVSKGIE